MLDNMELGEDKEGIGQVYETWSRMTRGSQSAGGNW